MQLKPHTVAGHGPSRSLEQLLDELVGEFNALPLTDRRRAPLASRIREVEALIDARQPL